MASTPAQPSPTSPTRWPNSPCAREALRFPSRSPGYHGLYVETSVPAHIDFSKCEDGYFDAWISTDGGGHYSLGPGQRDRLWILDIHGYRLVIDGWHMPEATRAQINQITRMVKTLTFRATA